MMPYRPVREITSTVDGGSVSSRTRVVDPRGSNLCWEAIMPASTKSSDNLHRKERQQFLSLLLANPNYFGNVEGSALKPVLPISGDTSYEQLMCVGFNPGLSRLEGVVWIKQPGGYNGGICTNGSLEYVSFYLSYNNGATWLPQGTVNFRVYDVPGQHPLEYAVSLTINPAHELCFEPNLPLVRAILSWNTPPSGPNATPVWGNRLDARIQIPGYLFEIPLPVLLSAAKLNIPADVASLIDDKATIKLQAPKAATTAELVKQYSKAKTAQHRAVHSQIQKAIKNPAALAASSAYLSKLGVDLAAAVAAIANVNGDTEFEQLECIGLEEGDGGPDALVGTLVVKLPTGYLGNPCTAGSNEYVAFWIDWGGGWQWAGTASVNVHDIASIPKGGLSYAVYLPVNLNPHRKPCEDGPVTARVRAILSWDVAPPPANPNYVPVWGNRLETTIFVNPGPASVVGNFTPFLSSICDVDICDIDQKSGWAYPGAGDKPFGASISIFGSIPGAPAFVDPPAGLPVYQVTVQQIDTATNTLIGSPQILTDPFTVTIQKQVGGGTPTSAPHTQNAVGGYFTYQQMTPSAAGWNIVSPQGLLAVWNSLTAIEGTWLISVTAWDASKTTQYNAGSFICVADGTTRQGVVIDLDEKAPTASLAITGYKPGGVGPCIPAVDCQTFTVGDVICGTYSMTDAHIQGLSLTAEPTPSPSSGFTVDGTPAINGESYPAIPVTVTSKSGEWTYNTAGLPPCGYTIQLSTGDRTIVDCVTNWENNGNFVGFCLVAPAKK